MRNVQVQVEGPVGTILLDRPEKANAYTQEMLSEMESAFTPLVEDPNVALIVFTSSTPNIFCAGADINEIKSRDPEDAFHLRSAALFDQIANCPKVVLAVITGPAIGGGLELSLACDLRIATPSATFALPELSLGILPAAGGLTRLPSLIGQARAKEMILLQKRIDAKAALGWGLVNQVFGAKEMPRRIEEMGEKVSRIKPAAIACAKRAIQIDDENQQRLFIKSAQALLTSDKS